jgi:hypothetical protein
MGGHQSILGSIFRSTVPFGDDAINYHLPSSINSILISPSEDHQHFTRAAGFSLRSKHHYESSIIAATAASFNEFAKKVDPMDMSIVQKHLREKKQRTNT